MTATRLVMVACGGKKLDRPARARDIYIGAFGQVLRKWLPADDGSFDVAIISAKHGLLHSDKVIEPYDQRMTLERAQVLSRRLANLTPFTGASYREFFIAGGDLYCSVAMAIVEQMHRVGLTAPRFTAQTTYGGIGTMRGQLAEYLRKLGSAA